MIGMSILHRVWLVIMSQVALHIILKDLDVDVVEQFAELKDSVRK